MCGNVKQKGRINRDGIIWMIAMAMLVVVLFVFFALVHPLYIYDTDDWSYISCSRHALPMVSQWNPAKILPETLMPFAAELGIRFIMPFTGDYIGSMAITFAIVLVLFIAVYVYQLGKMFRNLFDMKTEITLLVLAIFVLYHFLPFSISTSGNKYLLFGGSVNCTFNYLIPGLLNATIVMWFMEQRKIRFESTLSIGVFILLIYLAINSNMFHSIILAAFAGANILISFVVRMRNYRTYKNKEMEFLQSMVKENVLWIAIDFAWFVMLTFEARGARAARASVGLFDLPIFETLKKFKSSLVSMNKFYFISMLGFICFGICVYFFNLSRKKIMEYDKRYMETILKIIISFLITWVYLILLSAKVSPEYMVNNLVEISWIFWIMLLAFISLAYILAKMPMLSICIPIFLYILIFETVIDGRTYAENNVAGFDSATVKALDDNIIRQIVEAENLGKTDVIVHIPIHSSKEWPIALSYGGKRISTTLFRHGITTKEMNVTLEMDPAINNKFHLQ